MKIAASILLFYFSFLAAQPVMPLIKKGLSREDKCTMPCCHKDMSKANHKMPANGCGNDMCNPFGQYACCVGFVIEKETSSPVTHEVRNSLIQLYSSGMVTGFYSPCWRPPENTVS